MSEIMTAALVLLGFAIGITSYWFLSRGRLLAQVDTAVAKAEMPLKVELCELRERIRSSEDARRSDQSIHEDLKSQAERWRNDLDIARDEIAKLTERASRVPALESELSAVAGKLRLETEEVCRLSIEAAQKGQAVTSLTIQIQALEKEKGGLEDKLNANTFALSSVTERKAALEEQVMQVPGLQESLTAANQQCEKLAAKLSEIRESSGADIARLNAELIAEREAHTLSQAELSLAKTGRDTADTEVARLSSEVTELRTRFNAEREAASEKLALLLEAKEGLTDQFRNLANEILEEKSKRFTEQNQVTLGQLLDPLKTQLTEFKGKVEEVYVQEGKDRSALSEQVRQLVGLNQALSQDAKNLTLALKGNAKTQGNWGELVLERVLEASGLRKGHEYHVQESQQREDGTRGQADVVINLPEERRLVVDAKVSLVAYEAHITADAEDQRALAIRRHLDSIRTHIKGLSSKQYQSMYGLKSLDFVLMFVPIEPAFMLAITHDNELFMDAWDKNVLLVSPSTLLFVVRTVAHLWRQEAQSRNAQDIAKRGAELYDRLTDFVKDLEMVGTRLRSAQEAYDSAHKRLGTGKGNVIRQAEMLRELGVKPTKNIPSTLVAEANAHEDIVIFSELAALAAANTPHESNFASGAPAVITAISLQE